MTPTYPLVLRLLRSDELEEAAQLVGRGMRDNPSNMEVFPILDGERRSNAMGRFFVPVLRGVYQRWLVLGAIRADRLVAICGMARPGFCQSQVIEKIKVLPAAVIGNPVKTPVRILNWVGEWARRDPSEPHWHLGPVAVEPFFQGQGIGTAMLNAFCMVVDGTGAHAYLETDKRENVRLYQRFGFTVAESAKVLGVPNWFMSRVSRAIAMSASNLRESGLIRQASHSLSGYYSGTNLTSQHHEARHRPRIGLSRAMACAFGQEWCAPSRRPPSNRGAWNRGTADQGRALRQSRLGRIPRKCAYGQFISSAGIATGSQPAFFCERPAALGYDAHANGDPEQVVLE